MTKQENTVDPITLTALVITGLTAAGKLIMDTVAAAGARGEALYDLAVTSVADLAHQLEEHNPARFKAVFDDARAKLRARFSVEAEKHDLRGDPTSKG